MEEHSEDADALSTAYALWRLRLEHYQQLARSGASARRLQPAAAAVLAAARDATALAAEAERRLSVQNQE